MIKRFINDQTFYYYAQALKEFMGKIGRGTAHYDPLREVFTVDKVKPRNPTRNFRTPKPDLKPESRNPRPKTRNPEPETRNPESGTPKPTTRNPKNQGKMGGVPREQKMLKEHLPRVIYNQVY